MPGLNRLGQRIEQGRGLRAAQHQVEAIVAIGVAGPFALARLDRLPQRHLGQAEREIEQRRCAAMERGAADLIGPGAEHILVARPADDRHPGMDVRVDAARNDDLPRGIDHPRRTDRGEAAVGADRGDLAARNPDIGRFGRSRHHRGAAGNDQNEHRAPSPH